MPQKGDPGTWLQTQVRPGDVVVDIGAADGAITRQLTTLVAPAGHVIAYEPDLRWAATLLALERQAPHVTFIPKAVANWEADTPFYQAVDPHHSSLFQSAVSPGPGVGVRPVPVCTLDRELVSAVDGLKIDAQGAEVAIVQGGTRVIGQCRYAVLEWWPEGIRASGADPFELIGALRACGRVPRWLTGEVITDTDARAWLAHPSPFYVNICIQAES